MRAWSVMVGQTAVGAPLHFPLYFALLILHAVAVVLVVQDESDPSYLEIDQSKLTPLHNGIFTDPPLHGDDSAAIMLNKNWVAIIIIMHYYEVFFSVSLIKLYMIILLLLLQLLYYIAHKISCVLRYVVCTIP